MLLFKPFVSSNILIDGHGTGKIGDFGFCKELPKVESGKSMFTAQTFARSEGQVSPLMGNMVPAAMFI